MLLQFKRVPFFRRKEFVVELHPFEVCSNFGMSKDRSNLYLFFTFYIFVFADNLNMSDHTSYKKLYELFLNNNHQ